MKHRVQLFILVLFSFALAPLASFAADEPPAVAAFLDALERQAPGYDRPAYGTIEPDGDGGAILKNVKWTMTQPEVTMVINIESVAISGVSKRASGNYSLKSVMSKNINISMDLPDVGPVAIKIPSATTNNIHLLPAAVGDAPDYAALIGAMTYEKSIVPVLTVSVVGQSFDVKNILANWAGDAETGLGKWNFSMESAVIPINSIPNPKFQKDMKDEFGIEKFDLGMDGSFSATGANGNLDIAYAFRFSEKQIGNFEMAIAARDIPGKLVGLLKSIKGDQPPNMGKIMPMVVGIKFAKLKLRFVDNNFMAKFIEFAAKKQGMSVETMTSNGAAMVQVGLMRLNLPEFSQQVVGAYNAFVKDPKNISLEASPATPIAVATLMGLMAAPAEAIKKLGVKVEANK